MKKKRITIGTAIEEINKLFNLCINIDGVLVPVEAVSIPQENIIIRRMN